MRKTIALVPIGAVSEELLQWLKPNLTTVVEQNVTLAPGVAIPEEAYDPERKQYNGKILLQHLKQAQVQGADNLLGIIDRDCYTPGLNYIFGQAVVQGTVCLVALPRLRSSFYDEPEDEQMFRQRVLKECSHELNHTWGLHHCPEPSCVMHFSNSLDDTDRKNAELCPECRVELGTIESGD